MRQAVAFLAGLSGFHARHLGPEWGDAIAADACEAEEIVFQANRQRDIAAARSRGGM